MNADRRLVAWLRQVLLFDDGDESSVGAPSAAGEELLAEVYRRHAVRRRHRARRRVAVSAAGAVLVVAGGGALAAAVWAGGQPSRPESGPVCRADADPASGGVVLAVGADPLVACRERWESGEVSSAVTVAPPLTACIGAGGVVEVFPGDGGVCERLGLQAASPTLDQTGEQVADLTARLVEEVNLAPCRPVADAAAVAESIVAESPLSDWTVVIEAGSTNGVCGKAAIESSNRTVTIHEF